MNRKSKLAAAVAAAVGLALPGYGADLRETMDGIAAAARGRVGIGLKLLETGETFTRGAGERFPMQSVYKFPIGMAVLDAVDRGALRLDESVRVDKSELVSPRQHSPIRDRQPEGGFRMTVEELLRYSVAESDGSACDVLLRLVGGPAAVDRYLDEKLGVSSGMEVRDPEQVLGRDAQAQYRNWATPEGAVAVLEAFHAGRGLSRPSRDRLMRWMIETPTGVRRIKALLPAGTVVAHKTGSSGTVNGMTAATNDIGIVTLPDGRHLAIAVLVMDSAEGDDAARDGVIARVAKAAWDHWVR